MADCRVLGHKKCSIEALGSQCWITSTLNRECTAFTPLLLALCPNVQTFGFELDLQNEPTYTIPWFFGFPHVEDAYEPYDIAIYGEEVQSFLQALGIHMPEATYLRTKGVDFEIVHMGFADLTTLDIDVRLFIDGHYGSSHICFGGPGYKPPKLRKAIFRLDWSELKPGPYKYRCVISEFGLMVQLPWLTSITAVLESSPQQPKYLNALCAGGFDILIDQIDTGLDNLSLDDPSYPSILQQVQDLNILVSDDAIAFKKDFLHQLKPITNLLNAAHLRKLTLPWQALATAGYDGRETSLADSMTVLPTSLKALRITYPQAPTIIWLQDLFEYAPEHKGNLQLVELFCCNTWGMPECMIRTSQQDTLVDCP